MRERRLLRWWSAARRLQRRVADHFLPLVAAGVAFYAFLALVPTIIVAITLYGVVADPAEIEQRLGDHAGAVPVEVRSLLVAQVRAIAGGGTTSRTAAVLVGTLLALWTASAGINSLVRGIDLAHGRRPRSFVEQRGLSIGLTLAAIVLVELVALVVVAVPPWLGTQLDHDVLRWTIDAVRWPALFLVMAGALSILYRVAGSDRHGLHLWPGPAVGAACWLVSSVGFSLYTANFARYARTYGSLAGVVVVLLWLWLGSLSVLLGAEVDAEVASRRRAAPTPEPTPEAA